VKALEFKLKASGCNVGFRKWVSEERKTSGEAGRSQILQCLDGNVVVLP
jgi:hypothetical protein